MCKLSPYKGIQRGARIIYGDHVEDAVLPVLEEDEITRCNRRGNVCDSQIVAGHVIDANGSSEHIWNRAMTRCANSKRG